MLGVKRKNIKLTAVVDLGETAIRLGPNISNLDTREGAMILQRANRNNKPMGTIILAIDDKTSLDQGMCTDDT